jgi:hypothetical protein
VGLVLIDKIVKTNCVGNLSTILRVKVDLVPGLVIFILFFPPFRIGQLCGYQSACGC